MRVYRLWKRSPRFLCSPAGRPVSSPGRLAACCLLLAGLLQTTGPATAADDTSAPTHPKIPGFERFFADAETPTRGGGLLLLGELNCTSCHAASQELATTLLPRQAPVLTEVGTRVRPEYLRKYLLDPRATRPGSTMPDVFTGLSQAERTRRVEALTHFLASTGTVRDEVPVAVAVARGEVLFHRVGCAVCHGSQRDGAAQLETSVPLTGIAEKYSIPGLTAFLQNPHAVRPSGRMPSLNLVDTEAGDIAAYLLRDIKVTPNVEYTWYTGDWQTLPDFSQLKPEGAGKAAGFDLSVSGKQNNHGVRFKSYLPIEADGEYTFHAGSDDGSRIALNDHTVVLNDGLHPFTFRSGKVKLHPGLYYLTVDFFQGGGGQELRIEYEGPGISRRPLSSAITLDKKATPGMENRFKVSKTLAAEGRQIFQQSGCASCHQLNEGGSRLKSQLAARPLAELNTGRGCLAENVPAGLPAWSLSAAQRKSLDHVLKSAESLQPVQRIPHLLTTFNCFACHQRGEIGGVEQARNDLFETTIPEMGDEGRIPPTLEGVGDKLNAAWLKHVLDSGANDRPYMLTRMPKFGAQAATLAKLLTAADEQTLAEIPVIDQPELRVQAIGRHLAGDKGLSCIKCHYVGRIAATGIQAMDLTTMTRRLREDWFQRYMINPQVYRRGTRMPSAFPGGRTILPDILDDRADAQLRALWVYLEMGNQAPVPSGMLQQAIVLVPGDEPIIYRNFIENAGPRAIAVGYPERANLAWDADYMRPALIWHNAFIDASRHWTGRGQGFERPLGDHVLALPAGVPLAVLPDEETAWPAEPAAEAGYRFLGYRLDEHRRPVFRYRLAEIEVEDHFVPEPGQPDAGFRRTITLKSPRAPSGTLWLRAAVGKVEPEEGVTGSWLIDGVLRLQQKQHADTADGAENAREPLRRTVDGKTELLLPVRFTDGKATLVLTYHW
ncbi:MAG: c-type cytochrome [Planctomycetaceae bacterium]|nr:c-type cytochrome [Planctomycetaceae bacterium]